MTKGKRYDVFHVHACSYRGFFPAVVGVFVGRLYKKRVILTYHGGGAESFFRQRRALVKFIMNKTSCNIVLSGFTGRIFDRYGFHYTIIPNILESSECFYRERSSVTPRFISIRSFAEAYNIGCTLRAFKIVQEKYPSAELILLGDGPLRVNLETFVNEKDIQNVSFVGQVPNSEIYQYLNKADIMVSASRFDNMPVSILEGFKAGLLVIASNVGGVPFILQDGKNGILFDSDDADMMAIKMIWAIEHPTEVAEMIVNARKSLEYYSWKEIKTKLIPIYSNG
ncbi:MAG: glycosyltransferase family 4 protein [Bacteroidales bacterium]|nr:glycosyltransferase family 4 protein [Bacteroidales bacterium]